MYLGIDVSKLTIDCCLITDGQTHERKFNNNTKGFQQLTEWLKSCKVTEMLHCVCEATGIYYEALAEYLHSRYTITVENPRKIKGYAIAELQRSKTDKQDARLIAQYCQDRQHKLRPWKPSAPQQKQLQELARYLEHLKQQRATARTKHHEAPDYIKPHIQTTIDNLNSQIKTVKQQIAQFYKDNPHYNTQRKRLKSITGIGEQAAAILLAVYQRHSFRTSKQFTAYLGLDPKDHKSGTSVKGKSRISKIGNADIRKSLYMPALVAYRCNALPAFVGRLKAKGKPMKLILVALMRKLVVIAFTLLANGQDFDKTRYA
ncbi:IS110 family transposase [Neisseria iguanae]|uniref:IS110 family transposase n=1 Tax=Neisseria iguanae TaxID=90242 RepID=A0A2P7TYU5_9NEIS|nr:IS110 family transposase [Neisseria iguanae]PSJ79896.1 IS110 family transposase [Neisseria iguanae]